MATKTLPLILFTVLLVACTGAPSAPALSGQSALDAQATLAVWSARETAVVEETRRAAQATVDAQQAAAEATRSSEQATAVYIAALVAEATATADAQAALQTQTAASATATWAALVVAREEQSIAATATADAASIAFQQAQAAQVIRERQAAIDRTALWTMILPWLVGAAIAAATVLILALGIGYVIERRQRARPVQAGDVWVMVTPSGPVVLNRPPPILPAGQPRRMLPAVVEVPDNAPIPLPETRYGHVLIAGETGSGKSTAMRAVLRARRSAVVLDPHSAGDDWEAAEVIGGGRDFEAIRDYMARMNGMLQERYAERAGGRTAFEPHTVAVDEMPAIVAAVGREIESIWREWLREGRKVGLFLVLATQSTRVRTLGIEGERDLLENFQYVIALGDVARREYGATGTHPAVLQTKGAVRPVIIPHSVGETPAPSRAPLVILPAPVEPDPDNLSDDDRERIVQAYRRTGTMAAAQRLVFPSYRTTGGRAFYAIRDVLIEAGERGPSQSE